MYNITTNIDTQKIDEVIVALSALGEDRLPNTALAVGQSVQMVQRKWMDLAKNAFARPRGDYLSGIFDGLHYPLNNNELSGAVINTVKHAHAIEYGIQSYDMKKALNTSSKVRISKDGNKYLIIPFRHGTPGAVTLPPMPTNIYDRARNLGFSNQTGGGETEGKVLKGVGDQGRRTKIAVRNPNNLKTFIHLSKKQTYTWKASPYAGMVKVKRDDTTNQGQYFTFRVMSEKSNGWIHPGTAPMKLAEKTTQEMNMIIPSVINAGLVADLNMLGIGK